MQKLQNYLLVVLILFCSKVGSAQTYDEWVSSLSAIHPPPRANIVIEFLDSHIVEFAENYYVSVVAPDTESENYHQSGNREETILENIVLLDPDDTKKIVLFLFRQTLVKHSGRQDAARNLLRNLIVSAYSYEDPIETLGLQIGLGFMEQVIQLNETPLFLDENPIENLSSQLAKNVGLVSGFIGVSPITAAGKSMYDGVLRLAEVEPLKFEAAELIKTYISIPNPTSMVEVDVVGAAWHSLIAFEDLIPNHEVVDAALKVVSLSEYPVVAWNAIHYLKFSLQDNLGLFDDILTFIDSWDKHENSLYKAELFGDIFGDNFWELAAKIKYIKKKKFVFSRDRWLEVRKKSAKTYRSQLEKLNRQKKLDDYDREYAYRLLMQAYSLIVLFPKGLDEEKDLREVLKSMILDSRDIALQTMAVEMYRAARKFLPSSVAEMGAIESNQLWSEDTTLTEFLSKNSPDLSCAQSFGRSLPINEQRLSEWNNSIHRAHSIATE